MVLIEGVKKELTLYQIGSILVSFSFFKPSIIEQLIKEAKERANTQEALSDYTDLLLKGRDQVVQLFTMHYSKHQIAAGISEAVDKQNPNAVKECIEQQSSKAALIEIQKAMATSADEKDKKVDDKVEHYAVRILRRQLYMDYMLHGDLLQELHKEMDIIKAGEISKRSSRVRIERGSLGR